MKFAVIQSGGKQYKVSEGDRVQVEKIGFSEGEVFSFEKVLLLADGDRLEMGKPYLSGVHVDAKVLNHGRDKKKIVFRYHSKTRYRKKKGHRQPFSEISITKIS